MAGAFPKREVVPVRLSGWSYRVTFSQDNSAIRVEKQVEPERWKQVWHMDDRADTKQMATILTKAGASLRWMRPFGRKSSG